jgi:transcriptional regulator GlxA family with amidase domain
VLYVDNGHVLTSAAAAAGLDLCLHLVRRDFGDEAAATVARAVVMPLERTGGQAQFIVREPPADDDTSIGKLLTWIEQNLSSDLSLPVIARRAAMSTRTLSRRFREQVGTTDPVDRGRACPPRATAARNDRLRGRKLATEAGFGSAAVLREHFREIVGTSPLSYRHAFCRNGQQQT